ncbi:hypothetical protein M1N70_01580 [Peptococcaceae bacterium]|nr:hypothetical protein [Peptococcaceae bacterium]
MILIKKMLVEYVVGAFVVGALIKVDRIKKVLVVGLVCRRKVLLNCAVY